MSFGQVNCDAWRVTFRQYWPFSRANRATPSTKVRREFEVGNRVGPQTGFEPMHDWLTTPPNWRGSSASLAFGFLSAGAANHGSIAGRRGISITIAGPFVDLAHFRMAPELKAFS